MHLSTSETSCLAYFNLILSFVFNIKEITILTSCRTGSIFISSSVPLSNCLSEGESEEPKNLGKDENKDLAFQQTEQPYFRVSVVSGPWNIGFLEQGGGLLIHINVIYVEG